MQIDPDEFNPRGSRGRFARSDDPTQLQARFWSKVNQRGPDECWPFVGAHSQAGYGRFSLHRQSAQAQRVAWLLAKGDIPKGLNVLHKCDNPPCCNPAHLFLGTYADNNRDRSRKGRNVDLRGEKSGKAKLTWEQVRQIRALFNAGETNLHELGRRFDIDHSVIWHIVHNDAWVE